MSKKILVAYFTKGGASEEYAQVIAETLSAHDLSVEMCSLLDEFPEIDLYDGVVLGTGVRMFMVYRRWKKILKRKEIKDKQLFLFLSSGMAADEPEKAVEKFLQPIVEKYKLEPDSMVSFPGKIPEKWEKYDDGPKVKMNPDLAKEWAEKIAAQIRDN